MPRSVYARFGQSALTGNAQTARRYTVVGGDTIPAIAARVFEDEGYSSEAWRQLAEENDIEDLDDVSAGDVLIVPTLQPVELK